MGFYCTTNAYKHCMVYASTNRINRGNDHKFISIDSIMLYVNEHVAPHV